MRRARASRSLVWIRALIGLLAVVVALAGALPSVARMVAGPRDHVCHCETGNGHAHCECPICFPELDREIGGLDGATLKGRCGEDDVGWRTFADPAVVPPGVVLTAARLADLLPYPDVELPAARAIAPDPRPPRAAC